MPIQLSVSLKTEPRHQLGWWLPYHGPPLQARGLQMLHLIFLISCSMVALWIRSLGPGILTLGGSPAKLLPSPSFYGYLEAIMAWILVFWVYLVFFWSHPMKELILARLTSTHLQSMHLPNKSPPANRSWKQNEGTNLSQSYKPIYPSLVNSPYNCHTLPSLLIILLFIPIIFLVMPIKHQDDKHQMQHFSAMSAQ